MHRILLIGATSAIAEHLARRLAAEAAAFYLTGRDTDRLTAIADDLRVRGASQVAIEALDVADAAALDGLVARAVQALGGLDTVAFAAGLLPDPARLAADPGLARQTLEVNAVSAIVALHQAADYFAPRGRGRILAIGSVAGDRGRAANAVYGAAKAALEVYLSGLRQQLHRQGIQVLLVKPGFVDTPMTAAFAKGGPLWATPERVARDIVRAMTTGRAVLYTPWFWRWIMLIVQHLPEPLFVRLRF